MAKTNPQSQTAFSFFDDIEKVEPQPKPRKHVLRPPAQIEAEEETEETDTQSVDTSVSEPAFDDTSNHINEPEEESATDIKPSVVSGEENISANTSDKEENAVELTTAQTEDIASESEQTVADNISERRNPRGRKSVKEHTIAAGMIEMPDDETLFSKQYYSMGEVTTMFRENHSLIRYWESEFDILKPKKNGKGDRFFRPVDVKNLYLIYDLLRRRKYTIEGAREYLKNNKKAEEKFAAVQSLEKIKSFFLELKANL